MYHAITHHTKLSNSKSFYWLKPLLIYRGNPQNVSALRGNFSYNFSYDGAAFIISSQEGGIPKISFLGPPKVGEKK